MSDLKDSVQAAIAAYVQSKHETHTPVDVLRMIRDESSLLYERQVICDVLDADPMQQLSHVASQVKRIQSIMKVLSCKRLVTLDGYARNDALIEWAKDSVMKGVISNVQLTFHYEQRRKDHSNNNNDSRVVYTIDVAKDYGEKQRLLVIEVFAQGEGPSAMPAEPLEDDDWEDSENQGDAMDAESIPVVETVKESREIRQECDRFAAYMDPEVFSDFIEWTQLGMDEYTTFFLLMTFPFYEHEWDLVGFALDSVFGEAPMDEDEVIEVEAGDEDDDAASSIQSQQEQDDDSDL